LNKIVTAAVMRRKQLVIASFRAIQVTPAAGPVYRSGRVGSTERSPMFYSGGQRECWSLSTHLPIKAFRPHHAYRADRWIFRSCYLQIDYADLGRSAGM
jgi:hypothetical protein